jgi:predicted nucleic acid-binding protein
LPAYTALFDACVLYPQTLRDVLLSLSRTELFRARWSADINDEWTRNRRAKHPEQAAQIQRTLELVNASVPDCLVTGYEALIPSLDLPDPNDRHVLAAAIVGRADVIVTLNLVDFPEVALAPYNIGAQHPDEFIIHQFGLDPGNVVSAFKAMRSRLTRPPMSAEEFLANLERKGLAGTAAELCDYVDLI